MTSEIYSASLKKKKKIKSPKHYNPNSVFTKHKFKNFSDVQEDVFLITSNRELVTVQNLHIDGHCHMKQ